MAVSVSGPSFSGKWRVVTLLALAMATTASLAVAQTSPGVGAGTAANAGAAVDGAAMNASVNTSTPDGTIRTLADSILQVLKTDPRIKAGDMGYITQVVNEKLLPYTDFAKTTRLAMGPGWRLASPAQRSELVRQFELLLIHTYAGATAKVGDQTVSVKPLRAAPDATDVVVRTQVMSQGKSYPVDYRLEKTAQGWKIYDVNVLGAWLIQAYRQQFSTEVQAHGVAGLIATLQARNQQLAAANAAGREDAVSPRQ
jgi:phospholipid transport system substrate-binding protein